MAKQKCYDEQQAISLQLKQQKEQNLKDVKDAEDRLNQQRAQNLKEQEKAASQLKQCKDQSLEEIKKLKAQIDTLSAKPGLYTACKSTHFPHSPTTFSLTPMKGPHTGASEHRKTVLYGGARYTVECGGGKLNQCSLQHLSH